MAKFALCLFMKRKKCLKICIFLHLCDPEPFGEESSRVLPRWWHVPIGWFGSAIVRFCFAIGRLTPWRLRARQTNLIKEVVVVHQCSVDSISLQDDRLNMAVYTMDKSLFTGYQKSTAILTGHAVWKKTHSYFIISKWKKNPRKNLLISLNTII